MVTGEIYACKQFTGPTTLSLPKFEGWRKMTILVNESSSGSALFRGKFDQEKTLFGREVDLSDQASISAGQTVTIGLGDCSIEDLTIELETGCTIEVIAVTKKNII